MVKHLDDLPKEMPMDQIPKYNPDKELDAPMSSLVLSGPEMMTMTESQWAQILAVGIPIFSCYD